MTLKKLLLSAVALAALTSGAVAADLPRRELAPAPIAASIPAFSWTGLYLGAHASGVVAGDYAVVEPTTPVGINLSAGGYTVGGTVGANYQFGVGSGIVVGVEGDVAYSDIHNNSSIAIPGFGAVGITAQTDGLSANARGRLGYAFDRVMVYGTGGYAYTDVKFGLSAGVPGLGVASAVGSTGLDGYVVGGGIEAAFLGNWSAKAEYLYSDYDAKALNFGTASGSVPIAAKLDTHVIKVGVNYRFGGNGFGLFGN
jgi:outer membrane immunogenic protein